MALDYSPMDFQASLRLLYCGTCHAKKSLRMLLDLAVTMRSLI